MRESIEHPDQRKRRRDAWHSAWISSLMMLVSGCLLLGLHWYYHLDGFWCALVWIGAILDLSMIIPVWFLLKVRLKEIKGGEEYAAAQY